jgi:hypothetical protein
MTEKMITKIPTKFKNDPYDYYYNLLTSNKTYKGDIQYDPHIKYYERYIIVNKFAYYTKNENINKVYKRKRSSTEIKQIKDDKLSKTEYIKYMNEIGTKYAFKTMTVDEVK